MKILSETVYLANTGHIAKIKQEKYPHVIKKVMRLIYKQFMQFFYAHFFI